MKARSLFFVLLFGIILKGYGQEPKGKICLAGTINYAFLGAGDYGGFYYNNSLLYSLKPSFQISASSGFLISSNDGKENIYLSHNNAYLLGDLSFKLIPIKTKLIDFYFEFGGSSRYRSEIETQGVFIINNKTTVTYTNETSFDIGYLGLIGLGFKVTPRTMIILNGEMHVYNKGSGISSFGLGVNIKL